MRFIPLFLESLLTDGSLQVSKKLKGFVNVRDFEQCKHIEIIVLAICWRLSAFKKSSHEKSILLKIRGFVSFKFFQGYNWLTNAECWMLNFMVIEKLWHYLL